MAQRLSQETVEAIIAAANSNVLLSQETVEALTAFANSVVRVSQVTVEAIIPSTLVTVTRMPRRPDVNHQNPAVV